MGRRRRYYLSLGSNVRPETNLAEAIQGLLREGAIRRLSGVWESHAVGSEGPNFLNLSIEFKADVDAEDLKLRVIGGIEAALGRTRGPDKNAPRTIDIDIVMAEDEVQNAELWRYAFVTVPMSELRPRMKHPITGRSLRDEATHAKASTWIRQRHDVQLRLERSPEA